MRILPLALVVASLVPAATHAQRAGLLLGLASDSGYRTLWIAPVGGRIAVAAELRGIVVPRDTGFMVLDVAYRCAVDRRADAGGPEGDTLTFLDEREDLLRYRLGESPPAGRPDAIDCADAQRRIKGSDRDGTPDIEEGERCNIVSLRITHAAPRLIALRTSHETTEFCSPARFARSEYLTVNDWAGEPVALLARMPPAAARALAARFARERGECAQEDSPDEAWGIERTLGGWQAMFVTSGAIACRGDSGGEVTATVPVPATLARRDDAATWLPSLRRRHGRVTDLFTAPTRDLVLAQASDALVAHATRGSALGEQLLRVRLRGGERAVMVEWASGVHVARWTRELATARSRAGAQ